MKQAFRGLALVVCAVSLSFAQSDHTGAIDQSSVSIGRNRPATEGIEYSHPYTLIGKHPKAGCDDTATCGEEFYRYTGHNLRTTLGTTWQGQVMCLTGSQPAACVYLALSTSAVTPAVGDSTLTGETLANGIACAGVRCAGTYAALSNNLVLTATPTTAVTGTTGTNYYYWVSACNGGLCTTPSTASGSASAAATLNATNYVTVSFTGQLGAASYQVYRTTSNTIPSGTVTNLVPVAASCSTVGTVVSCTVTDVGAALTSVTIGTTANTSFGEVTLTKTWTATGTVTGLQSFGVFNATSVGTMCFEGTFASVSLNSNDTFQLVESIYF
jgi:hypothetical protein